eukprot:m.175167 g.175167  ORF g.175167 m.175167 type:complete len:125 (+) comp16771_c0_seq3:927-1301(+)
MLNLHSSELDLQAVCRCVSLVYDVRVLPGEVELWKVLLSGAGAASVGAFVSTPMDVVKSNLQGTNPRHTTMGAEARALYSEGGAKVFLRGWLPRCVSIGPLFGVTLLSYVVQKELVDKLKLDEE